MSADKDARIAELERKLAEQQAIIKYALGFVASFSAQSYINKVSSRTEELNKLLAAEKEEGRVLGIAQSCPACHSKGYEEGKREAMSKDTARLDFVLEQGAFVVKRKADSGAHTYQLWVQDEDEVHHVLHGESLFLQSPRDAIDAAMLAAAPKPQGE